MGLWIKNDDGSIEKVAGSGGGGGSFDGEHVLTGDVDNPPEELAVGQLMWDGVEGSSGGSGGGSFDGEHVPTGDPTDPAMFEALDVGQLLYDGVEDTGDGGGGGDYLPLAGGTVTGDLTVDGNAKLSIFMPSDHKYKSAGTVFISHPSTHFSDGLIGSFGRGKSKATSIISNGYPTSDGWKSLGAETGSVGATQLDLHPHGGFEVRVAEEYPTGSAYAGPPVQFTVTQAGPTFRAMPSKTRTVDDVLERAETAEFPPEDDEGVATMDGYDEVPLFEVVSALLAKVKELSAEIEELKGA